MTRRRVMRSGLEKGAWYRRIGGPDFETKMGPDKEAEERAVQGEHPPGRDDRQVKTHESLQRREDDDIGPLSRQRGTRDRAGRENVGEETIQDAGLRRMRYRRNSGHRSFNRCPGGSREPILRHEAGFRGGVPCRIEVLTCPKCGRNFGSMKYYKGHGRYVKIEKDGSPNSEMNDSLMDTDPGDSTG
jgi:hypothetical protein